MSSTDSFAVLMQRLQEGDPEAAAMVYAHHVGGLIGMARRQLAQRARGKIDPDDVAQSVFRSFFRRAAEEQFDIDSESSLWALLAEITLRKCGRWNRHFATRKRNVAREAAAPADGSPAPELADPHAPTPADAAVMVDLLDNLMRGLDERERLVCELRLQDCEVEEIAARTGWSQATVYRRLHRIKQRLRRLCQSPEEGD